MTTSPATSMLRLFPVGGFGRRVAVLAGGTASGQALVLLASPVLARLYAPADFGVLAIYSSLLSLTAVVSSLRYEAAIPLAATDDAANDLAVLSLGLVVLVSTCAGLGVVLFGAELAALFNAPSVESYGWLLAVGVLGAGTYQVLAYLGLRHSAYGSLGRTRFVQGLVQVSAQLLFGVLALRPLGLLVGDVLGRASGSGVLGKAISRALPTRFRRPTWHDLISVATRYRRFPLYSSWSALLNASGVQLPGLLLAALYGPEVLGWYALTQWVLGVPLTLIANSVSQVFFADAAKRSQSDDDAGLTRLFGSTTRKMLLLGVPIAGAAIVLGPSSVELVFGSEWHEAGVYLRILAVMHVAKFVASSTGTVLDVLERQDLHLAREIVRTVLVISAIGIAVIAGLNATQAVMVFGAAGTIAYLVHGQVSWLALTRRRRI